MDPDDPRGATILEELSLVTQLSRGVKFARETAIVQPNGRACSSMALLKRADPRRGKIVNDIWS